MPRKGSKRRKTRTHVKPAANAAPAAPGAAGAQKTPKSFVVQSGTVGGTVSQLTKDVRRVLEPNTASRLRERKANRLRDYVSMSGPLGVTHLLVLSQPPTSSIPDPAHETTARAGESAEQRAERSLLEGTTTVNLRLIRLPRGPTLNFKVLRYSLAADVLRMARRPRAVGREFAEAPLLILSGFGGEDKQLKLMTTVFQNLFPPIHVQTMALSSARRVVLLSYNATTHTIDFRHYVIQVRPVGVSRSVRKIIAGSTNNKAVPLTSRKRPLEGTSEESEASDVDNDKAVVPRPVPTKARGAVSKAKGILDLSRADDISDYILRQEQMGFVTSDSEVSDMSDGGESAGTGGGASDSEQDEKKGKVRLAGDYVGRGNRGKGARGDKRAVRLVELGPRIELGLVKIEEGVGEGEVLFHEMVHKTNREAAELAKVHAARRKLAAERRAQQEANVAAKKAAANKGKGVAGDDDDDDEESEEENPELVPAVGDDVAIDTYEREHGLQPGSDEELFDDQGEDDEDFGGSDEDAEMAPDSDADDSHSEEGGDEPWGDEDDSDTSPIPLSQAYQLSDVDDDDEDLAPPPKKSSAPPKKKARVGPASFSSKQFKRIDKDQVRQAKTPIGIALPRPATKKERKRAEDAEKKRNGGKKLENSAKPAGDDDREQGDRGSGGRGGRGGARGGGAGRGGGGGGRGGRGGGGGRGGRGRGK